MSAPSPPNSATSLLTALTTITSLLFATYLMVRWPFKKSDHSAIFVLLFVAASIALVDLSWNKVHQRATTGLVSGRWEPSLSRTITKLLGLLGSIAFIAILYWLFPEYGDEFYQPFFKGGRSVFEVGVLLAFPYIYVIDAKMAEPKDTYWQMGCLLSFRWGSVKRGDLWNHLRAWLVKGFFLPLMFVYFCQSLKSNITFDYSSLNNFADIFDFSYNFIFYIDLGIVSVGYIFSLRILDSHIRSTEPTMYGWVVAIICYQPFYALIGNYYLAYDPDYSWNVWLSENQVLYTIWGSLILVLVGVYSWASVMFGVRFSNLTHRGILTNGPYRWTKHPAYISKNISWWMVSAPFLMHNGVSDGIKRCVLLLMLNCIYYLRAKTEERHLSQDPTYVQYARWIEEHGLFRWWSRLFPEAKYQATNR